MNTRQRFIQQVSDHDCSFWKSSHSFFLSFDNYTFCFRNMLIRIFKRKLLPKLFFGFIFHLTNYRLSADFHHCVKNSVLSLQRLQEAPNTISWCGQEIWVRHLLRAASDWKTTTSSSHRMVSTSSTARRPSESSAEMASQSSPTGFCTVHSTTPKAFW